MLAGARNVTLSSEGLYRVFTERDARLEPVTAASVSATKSHP